MASALRKNLAQWLPVGLMFLLLLIALALLNLATFDPQKANEFGEWQFYLYGFILLILSIAIFTNLIRAFYQWHTQQAGSRFTLRLMSGFLILTLLPVMVVSLFSMNFIGTRIDRWFAVPIESALDDSVELSQMSLEIRTRQHLTELERLGATFLNKTDAEITDSLEQFLREMGAQEVLLLSSNQRLVSISVANAETLLPHFPANDLFQALNLRDYYSHLEPVGNDGLFSRVALKVQYGKDRDTGILTALFPTSERERSLAESVEAARREYKSLSFQRNQLTNAFRITLLIIMVLTVLFALWAAFVFSRRLTRPVRTLVEGTLAVAAGDLEKKLPVSQRDDFSLLARSFNTMTKRLSDAQQEREQARRQLQQEHDYLHVVLEHLSSGVITLDEGGVIRRVNSAASNILRQPLLEQVGRTLSELGDELHGLQPFLEVVHAHWLNIEAEEEWQSEISLNTDQGRLLLVCRGAALPADATEQKGSVLVFDDVTDLIEAEHDAAWGEVARRLAHEIKNPLTPIQLSAERLTRKLSRELGADSASFLKRMTDTIIHQVDNLKSMVNAFSEYARAPTLQLQRTDLNALVAETAELYRTNQQKARIDLQLEPRLPLLRLDVNRIRQLLVNLTKNALEALEEKQQHGIVQLVTRQQSVQGQQAQAILMVRDNGPGIPPELLPRLFEPYVTSKYKGTGLGLAIVKKIVEEHGGQVTVHNHEAGGAVITVKFPLDGEG